MALSLSDFILAGIQHSKVEFNGHVIEMSMEWIPSKKSYMYSIAPLINITNEGETKKCYYVYYTPSNNSLNGLTILYGQSKENCDLPQTRTGTYLLQLTDAIAMITGASKNNIQDEATITAQNCESIRFALYRIATGKTGMSWYEEHGYRPAEVALNEALFETIVEKRKDIRKESVESIIGVIYNNMLNVPVVIPGIQMLSKEKQEKMLLLKHRKNKEVADKRKETYSNMFKSYLHAPLIDAVQATDDCMHKALLLQLFNECIQYDINLVKYYTPTIKSTTYLFVNTM